MLQPTEYWAILEAEIAWQNPISRDGFESVYRAVAPQAGAQVLDIGCGRGDWLIAWAQRAGIRGVGLELNPTFCAIAGRRAAASGLSDRLTFIEGPAADTLSGAPPYDIGLCIGASFALGGCVPTLTALLAGLRPGGMVVIGEPFRRSAELAPQLHAEYGDLPTLSGLADTFCATGLTLITVVCSSDVDWDHYVSQHWRAGFAWAAAHPADRRSAPLYARLRSEQQRYLAWEREQIGYALLVGRRSAA